MSQRTRAPSSEISRRGFLGAATAAVGGLFIGPARASPAGEHLLAGDPARLTPFEREHLPVLHAPGFTINKAKVPLVVEMAHPMTADHYIESTRAAAAAAGPIRRWDAPHPRRSTRPPSASPSW